MKHFSILGFLLFLNTISAMQLDSSDIVRVFTAVNDVEKKSYISASYGSVDLSRQSCGENNEAALKCQKIGTCAFLIAGCGALVVPPTLSLLLNDPLFVKIQMGIVFGGTGVFTLYKMGKIIKNKVYKKPQVILDNELQAIVTKE